MLVTEKFTEKKWGEAVSKVSVEIFLSQLPKQFVGELFTLSLVSGIENVHASEGYVTIFRGIFLSQSTEPFRRVTFQCCVSEISGGEKNYGKEGEGGVSIFSVEHFLSQSAEKFRRGTFSLSFFSGIEKIYASEGFVTIFHRFFFVSQYRNTRRGTLLCCVSENCW